MEGNYVYVLRWYGPFCSLEEVRQWESAEGNDTYLYIYEGKKKFAKKRNSFYCGQAFRQSSGKRMSNKRHHIEGVKQRGENLKIWVAKFENIVPEKEDLDLVECMFISFMNQCMIDEYEEVDNKICLKAPKEQLYIINEWYDRRSEEVDVYHKGTLYSRIPDVMALYETGYLYVSSKLTCRYKMEQRK